MYLQVIGLIDQLDDRQTRRLSKLIDVKKIFGLLLVVCSNSKKEPAS